MYRDAGWIDNPDTHRMQSAVDNTSEWFVARSQGGEALGIGRVITDYVRYAFIVDVIVQQTRHGEGIGTAIMEDILSACEALDIDSVHLWPSKGKASFYERFGFSALPADQPHMKLRAKHN